MTKEEKASELAQKYFPNANNIWARPNLEAKFVKQACLEMARWVEQNNLWHPADGKDLPEIDREVIALVGLCGSFEIQNEEPHVLSYKVVFAHRPPEYWDGTNIDTGKVTRYTPKTYGKGGWNIPDVKWWLDLELPKMEG